MAYHKPSDIDGYVHMMAKADMRLKSLLAEDLVSYLSDMDNSIECTDLGLLIDALMPWLTGSHFKIAQKSLEAFTELINRLGQDFNVYTPTVLPHVVDRLGDTRDTVREKAQLLLGQILDSRVLTPQTLLDKLTPCFKHKNAKVREEFLYTIVKTINIYGTQSLSLKAYIQPIVSLLADPTAMVRDAAIHTLVEVYKHVGDKLRIDLRKKEIHPTKMILLEQKFDEARNDGLLLPSALQSAMQTADEPDTTPSVAPRTRLVKRTPSVQSARKPQTLEIFGPTDAGAVTWEVFEASFELVPSLTIFSAKDMDDTLKSVNLIIGNKNMDWEKRVEALKKIRSLIMLDPAVFSTYFKELSISFLDILKELRSQVIREACITIAYMSKTFKARLDTFVVYILQELINLVPNSVKIISSAGTVALKYVVKYSHASKLIPIITSNQLQSKSKDIRSTLCEIVGLLFEDWPTKAMERFAMNLRESVQKGIHDADNDARRYSRRNFWAFKRHFPEMADQIYLTLDASTQKAVEREQDLMASNGTSSMSVSLRGSNSSLNSMPGGVIKRRLSSGLRSPATAIPTASVSTENLTMTSRLQRAPSLTRTYSRSRSGITVVATPTASRDPPPPMHRGGFRSISAVDTAAAQRARVRAQYSNLARLKVTSGTASLQGQMAQQARAKKITQTPITPQQNASPEHRITSRRAGVSQSQPASRSTSPSSRNYGTYSAYRQTGTIPKKKSGIPRSLANSRETSPTRPATSAMKRNIYPTSSPRRTDRPPINPTGRPVLAQKILQASREAENALADALSPEEFDISGDMSRMVLNRKIRDESDESEASSVCSERSFDSNYRRNDSGSWNGSRNKLDAFRTITDDIDAILNLCASMHWADRKDGLTNLTQYLSDNKRLSPQNLDRVIDLFRTMFSDTHTKVYSLFLDAVNELILVHSGELNVWLFVLLTRLFHKLGTELLGSMFTKIWKTLQLVHEYFPPDVQMQVTFRIMTDASLTPSNKVKIAELRFLESLAKTYCTSAEFQPNPPADKAVLKLLQWSVDQKSKDLRQHAQQCVIALYNCNSPSMTSILTNLPKNYQDNARAIISQHLRSNSGTNSPSSPLSCSSPKLLLSPQQGPFSLQNMSSQRSRQSSVEHTDGKTTTTSSQFMNTEEVQRSLRKTTAEIQTYYETKLDRDSNSKDSGISLMGGGTGDHPIDHFAALTGSMTNTIVPPTSSNGLNGHHLTASGMSSYERSDNYPQNDGRGDEFVMVGRQYKSEELSPSTTTTESNTPENTVRLDGALNGAPHYKMHSNGTNPPDFKFNPDGSLVFENEVHESDMVRTAIMLTQDSSPETVTRVLAQLSTYIRHSKHCSLAIKNFKVIMKNLLLLMQSTNTEIIIAALDVIQRVIQSPEMKDIWTKFLELIVLKIIDCYKSSKEVGRKIDYIIPRIGEHLPLDPTINILNPIIETGAFPTNLCAIKIMTELAEKQGTQISDTHLDSIMSKIIPQTDDTESMVRKAAVFCIVKLYVVLGEDRVRPQFAPLNSSKVRLLNVYISKSQNKSFS